jgi:3-oxoacyl-[acyl-carrier-protein] synthase-3
VIGSEMMSRLIDWSDRNTCVLFGDGAGAVVLEASDKPGIIATDLFAQGSYDDMLYVDNAQMGDHMTVNSALKEKAVSNYNKPLEALYPYVHMEGKKVFKVAVTKFGEMAKRVLEKNQLTPAQIDWLIPHQANMRIIQAAAEKAGMPMEKVICTVATHSNTSSASVPLALDVAVRDGRIQRGQLLLMEAFGAGLTWGSALVRF